MFALGWPSAGTIPSKRACPRRGEHVRVQRGPRCATVAPTVNLVRLYGFAIEPQRLAGDLFTEPLGGKVPIRKTLRVALDNFLRTAEKSGKMTDVTLRLTKTRKPTAPAPCATPS